MEIRRAKKKDLDTIIKLNRELFLFEKNFSDKYNVEWPTQQAGIDYFRYRIESGIVFLADEDGRAIGYVCGKVFDNYFNMKDPHLAELENMFVEEGYRGKGVGKMLIEEFEKECRAEGAKAISVRSIIRNSNAVEFYKSVGFDAEWVDLYKEI
jgi:GNAT superfamily N-acetyltransferase